jgi:hypothetical protein
MSLDIFLGNKTTSGSTAGTNIYESEEQIKFEAERKEQSSSKRRSSPQRILTYVGRKRLSVVDEKVPRRKLYDQYVREVRNHSIPNQGKG